MHDKTPQLATHAHTHTHPCNNRKSTVTLIVCYWPVWSPSSTLNILYILQIHYLLITTINLTLAFHLPFIQLTNNPCYKQVKQQQTILPKCCYRFNNALSFHQSIIRIQITLNISKSVAELTEELHKLITKAFDNKQNNSSQCMFLLKAHPTPLRKYTKLNAFQKHPLKSNPKSIREDNRWLWPCKQ